MTRASVCFLGCGAITAHHIGVLNRFCGKQITRIGVASRNADRARDFRERFGLDDHFASYESAIDSGYEVIVIGVPPTEHRRVVEQALARGKHLLIEKPVFGTFAELEALWPALKAHRATVMVAENMHFAPFPRRLRALLEKRDLGQPMLLDVSCLAQFHASGWRADPQSMPLGALHEGGVHWIRVLMNLASAFEPNETDHVVDLWAVGPPSPITPTPREDTVMVTARHRSGLISRLLHTWAVPQRFVLSDCSRVLLAGGAVYFDARRGYGYMHAPSGRRLLPPALRDRGGFQAMWHHFLDCVNHGVRPELTLEHVFADFAYMDAAYRSLRSGQAEPLAAVPGAVLRLGSGAPTPNPPPGLHVTHSA